MNLTRNIIIWATAGLVAYDVWAAVNNREGDTISEVITAASKRRPVIAFVAGGLAGHLFWSQEGPRAPRAAPAAPDVQ
ncbi:MAG TPA: hypothetical protein VGX48_18680 [Pyrinomonadaceae bacterium]|jgi:hypothetical protein|nr:hypothetical protein [Pyrinomonadaceae bacterium]